MTRLKGHHSPDLKNAQRSERAFRPGQIIRWNPPVGAYGSKSMQAISAGQTGRVERIYNDSYLLASIAGWTGVLLNTDFVENAHD